jgi:DNA-binding XRE family transcriptional regulator
LEALAAGEGEPQKDTAHDLMHALPDPTFDKHPDFLQIKVSPDVAFMVQLRVYRHRKKLTQNQMKNALGMKSRNSYVKLERKGNPTFKTAGKILKAFPGFPMEDCFAASSPEL